MDYRKVLKRELATLIAKEMSETLKPKEIESIRETKKEIRNRLMEYDIKKLIYKGDN